MVQLLHGYRPVPTTASLGRNPVRRPTQVGLQLRLYTGPTPPVLLALRGFLDGTDRA